MLLCLLSYFQQKYALSWLINDTATINDDDKDSWYRVAENQVKFIALLKQKQKEENKSFR